MTRGIALASVAAGILVVVAVAAGLGAARALAPARTPGPTFTVVTATLPPPLTDDPDAVFRQPLAAGCATKDAVWVFSEGGGIGRWDGRQWSLVDRTLRSLSAASCRNEVAVAIGGGGRVVLADDVERSIRPHSVQPEDLHGLAPLADGLIAVGSRGTVLRESSATGWVPFAKGIEEDLYGVVAFGPSSAWAVGAGGATYRLEAAGWRPVPSGVTSALHSVAGPNVEGVVAVGDGGVVLAYAAGGWQRVSSGTELTLRSAALLGAAVWIAGDGGTLLLLDPTGGDHTQPRTPVATRRIELGTTCTLRGVFTRGSELWIVGSDGARAGVWRRAADASLQRWGSCP